MNDIIKASFNNDFETIKTLLETTDEWNSTGFMEAQLYEKLLKNNQFDILNTFIEKELIVVDVFELDNFNNSIFSALLTVPFTDELNVFLDDFLSNVENLDEEAGGKTYLAFAMEKKKDQRFLDKLMDNGSPVNEVNAKDETLLFEAKTVDAMQQLLDQGLDVNAKNVAGNTVLHQLAANGTPEMVQLLLDYGAETNLQNNKGETVYHSVVFQTIDAERYELLAATEPPRLDLLNAKGQSLFMEFANNSQLSWDNELAIFQLMLRDGADMFQEEKDAYDNPATAAQLLMHKSLALFKIVIESDGFEVNQQDNNGNTCLHLIAQQNLNFDQTKATELYKKVKLLLNKGADTSLRNDQDKTPIDLASDDNLKAKAVVLMYKQNKI